MKDGDTSVEHYEGEIVPDAGFKNAVPVNLVYVDMKQSIPQYYAKNPKIFVNPDEPGAEADAEIAQLALNILWNRRKMKPLMRDSIKSAKLYGVCGYKTYFNYKKDFIKDEWTDRVENDDVRTDRVPLKNLLKEPTATWSTSSWIGHEVVAKVSDIAKKFGISKDDITVEKSDRGSKDLSGYDDIDLVKSDFQYGIYYEIEDRKEGKILYIVNGLDKFARKPADKTYDYDSMYDFLEYNDLPDRPDTKSDYFFWRAQLLEVATFRTMLLNHAKKGNAKYLSKGEELSADEITQLKSSDDSVVVQLGTNKHIEPLQHSGIDSQVFAAENAVRQDIQVISKQAPRQSQGKKTATEVEAVEAAAQEISSENLDRLEAVMSSIANKWVSLMQKNYSASKMVALTGMPDSKFADYQENLNGAMVGTSKHPFLKFTKDHIKKKLTASIKAGSTVPDNDQTRMAKFQGFMKFVAAGNLMPGVDLEEVLKEAVEVFDVRNDNLTLKKDNPMEESRLLNDGVYISPKITENHAKHLAIHEMESNGNNENVIHILGHKMFMAQMKMNQMAEMAAAPAMPKTGQSFVGAEPAALPPQPAPQPVPVGPQPAPVGAPPISGGG